METTSRSFIYVTVAYIAILMISNTVAVKVIGFGPFTVAGAIFIFPLTYIFGDILTEIYGYRASRKIIWLGFGTQILMSLCYLMVGALPAASFWTHQDAYQTILGLVPRIVLASMLAYPVGEFSNSFVLSKLKIITDGKYLWIRTISSTIVGEGLDTIIFVLVAFAGSVPTSILGMMILSQYILKVGVEVVFTPITYLIVNKIKKFDGIDTYDRGISYNPFK